MQQKKKVPKINICRLYSDTSSSHHWSWQLLSDNVGNMLQIEMHRFEALIPQTCWEIFFEKHKKIYTITALSLQFTLQYAYKVRSISVSVEPVFKVVTQIKNMP